MPRPFVIPHVSLQESFSRRHAEGFLQGDTRRLAVRFPAVPAAHSAGIPARARLDSGGLARFAALATRGSGFVASAATPRGVAALATKPDPLVASAANRASPPESRRARAGIPAECAAGTAGKRTARRRVSPWRKPSACRRENDSCKDTCGITKGRGISHGVKNLRLQNHGQNPSQIPKPDWILESHTQNQQSECQIQTLARTQKLKPKIKTRPGTPIQRPGDCPPDRT